MISLWHDLTTAEIVSTVVRNVFYKNSVKPADKECENCGGIFTAMRSSTATRGDGLRLYCSKKCSVEGSRLFQEKTGEKTNLVCNNVLPIWCSKK
jgi:ribosomal protein S27AE